MGITIPDGESASGDYKPYFCIQCLTIAEPDAMADLADIADTVGLAQADGNSAGLLVADFNDDGLDDLLFIRHYPTPELLFLDVAADLGFTKRVLDADFADIDGDGDVDIALATDDSFEIYRLARGVDRIGPLQYLVLPTPPEGQ